MKRLFAAGIITLASVQSLAGPDSPEWQELVTPLSQIEFGLGTGHGSTPAFANTTKIDATSTTLIGAFDLKGGAPYSSGDVTRWRLLGSDLGRDNHALKGEYAAQGRYRLNFGYDQILRFRATDGYTTPYAIANVGAGGTALSLGQRHPFDFEAKRQRGEIGGTLWLTPELEFRAAFHQDRQTGARATGAAFSGTGGSSVAAILPEPIDTTTRRFVSSFDWQKGGNHLTAGYEGSFFSNEVSGWTFPDLTNTQLKRMGSAPDNQMHRLHLGGGYALDRTTRLTGSLAYARLTQDDSFLPYSTAANSPPLPRSDLDGLVVMRQLNLRITSRPLHGLRLNGSYRFDERDNRTPVNEYALPGSEIGSAVTLRNTPYSRRTRLGRIEAGYAVRPGSDLTLTTQREETARTCHDHADCTEVPNTRENSWKLEWRQDFAPGINGRIAWSAADRQGDDYQKFHDSIELAGMRKFFLADRQRSQLRTSLNALLTGSLSLGVGIDASRDDYRRSPYGLQAADSTAFNLDLSQSLGEDLNIAVFYTREQLRSRLASSYATTAPGGFTAEIPGNQWQANMDDDIDTLGLSIRDKRWLAGRLELEGDLVFVRTRSPYEVVGGPGLSTQALPAVTRRSTELRLTARYALDDVSALRLAYLYRRLTSADFALDLYTTASLSRLLGTEETAPRYAAHVLGISYNYRFR